MLRRDQCCGLAFRNNYRANRLASRSAALSQNSILNPRTRTAPAGEVCGVTNRDTVGMCRQRRIARFGSLYEEWRTVLFELVFAAACGEHRRSIAKY